MVYLILGRVSIAMIKHHDQSNLGKKTLIWLTHHSPLRKAMAETQRRVGTWRQELAQVIKPLASPYGLLTYRI